MKNYKKLCVLGLSLGLTFSSVSTTSSWAAEYPPVVQTPDIGDELISKISPIDPKCEVFVPIVSSENPATAKTGLAKRKSEISKFPNLISNVSFAASPYLVKANIVLGGVSKTRITSLPKIEFNSRACAEIQFPANTAVRITVDNLAKSSQYTIKIGKTTIGKINSNTKGQILLPVISVTKFPQNYNLYLQRGTSTYKLALRSTK